MRTEMSGSSHVGAVSLVTMEATPDTDDLTLGRHPRMGARGIS